MKHLKAKNRGMGLSDKVFDRVSVIIMSAFTLVIIYPIFFVLIASISDPNYIANGEVFFFA